MATPLQAVNKARDFADTIHMSGKKLLFWKWVFASIAFVFLVSPCFGGPNKLDSNFSDMLNSSLQEQEEVNANYRKEVEERVSVSNTPSLNSKKIEPEKVKDGALIKVPLRSTSNIYFDEPKEESAPPKQINKLDMENEKLLKRDEERYLKELDDEAD